MSDRFEQYQDYLRSEAWSALRKRFFEQSKRVKDMRRAGGLCCEFCRRMNVPLDLHHRTYKRLCREKLTDLVLLCRECHDLIHDRRKLYPDLSVWKCTQSVARQKMGRKPNY